jgi:hypothetical protein
MNLDRDSGKNPSWPIIRNLDQISSLKEKLQSGTSVLGALADSTCGNELSDPLRWVNENIWRDLEELDSSLKELKAAIRQTNQDVNDTYNGRAECGFHDEETYHQTTCEQELGDEESNDEEPTGYEELTEDEGRRFNNIEEFLASPAEIPLDHAAQLLRVRQRKFVNRLIEEGWLYRKDDHRLAARASIIADGLMNKKLRFSAAGLVKIAIAMGIDPSIII